MSEFFQRIGLAFKCFFLVLFAGRLPDGIPERYFGASASGTGVPARVSAGTEARATAGTEARATDARSRTGVPAGGSAGTEARAAAGTEPRATDTLSGTGVPARHSPEARATGAVQLLALFQRDGRLVDFLSEDIAAYPDDQVGAAVREVHASCRQVLEKYVSLEPVMAGEEGRPTTVEPGFDVACVKLVGTVTGKPPFRGILRHKGWRARRVDLPSIPGDAGHNVIAPAEVEIG